MANLSQFLASSSPRAIDSAGPGSNGFWRRQIYRMPGTYTWVAPKSGRVKIQALGAAAGGQGDIPGPSGAYGEKTLNVIEGQTLTIVVGAGTAGTAAYGTTAARAGTTSISGAPVGGTPLSLVGSVGAFASSAAAVISGSEAGVPTGPWDRSFPGAKAVNSGTGGPSSGSPFGPGLTGNGRGGSGWGGATFGGSALGGGSTHNANYIGDGVAGLISKLGETRPFWDMESVDSGGGRRGTSGTGGVDPTSGPGAGGGYSDGMGGSSGLGGGTGQSGGSSQPGGSGGPGAGGGAAGSAGTQAGRGGDGFVMIFFDEVF